ncbi:MAG: hypothetical protein VB060_07720 [Oscillibacter sp.]|nr:hypothetical protein [Oscillibacter sp.]
MYHEFSVFPIFLGNTENFALQNDEKGLENPSEMTEIMKNKKYIAGILAKLKRVGYDNTT